MNEYDPNINHRRSIRLKEYDYSLEGLYFVTLCCQGMTHCFGKIRNGEMVLNDAGKIVDEEWRRLVVKYPHIALREHIVMSNHFHGIVQIVGVGSARPDDERKSDILGRADPAPTDAKKHDPMLGALIAYFKYQCAKKINLSTKLWQRNYYEHVIRTAESHQRIADYIANNPANWVIDKLHCRGGVCPPLPKEGDDHDCCD